MKPFGLGLLTSLVVSLAAATTQAEPWPARPIRAIIPVGAGSTTDIVPRVVFEQLSSQLGQPIVVDNKAGAGTTIGASLVAKADPDGYTILVNSSAHAISPSLYASLPYDPVRDFAGVIPIGVSPAVLVVSPSRGFTKIQDFVSAAKTRPGAFNFSSVGVGSATHLSAERFVQSAGIDAVHVPFKGGAEAMNEVIAGRIDFFFGPVGLVAPAIRDGRLTGLALNGLTRVAALPEVPTVSEAGFVDAEYPIWFGLFVPAKTPRDIVDRLHRECVRALQDSKVQAKLAALGVEPMPMQPAEFDEYVKKEIAINRHLVRLTGLKPE